MQGKSGNTRRLGALATIGAMLAATVTAVWLASTAGVTGAIDDSLRGSYYRLRGARSTSAEVVLVVVDESTAARWGRPPWDAGRLDAIVAGVLQDEPRVVAVLESATAALAATGSAVEADDPRVIAPASAGDNPGVLVVTDGAVRAIATRDAAGAPTVIGRLADKLGRPGGDALPVNFLGPVTAVPTIAAHRVLEAGELPAGTFAGRVVLIGAAGALFAQQVPTPLGPMSAADVQAHGALTLIDGTAWRAVPGWVPWLAVVALALAGAMVLPRLTTGWAVVIAGAAVAAVVGADYWLFAAGVAEVGAARPAVAVAVALGAAWLVERRRAHDELIELARWLTEQAEQVHERSSQQWDDRSLERFLRAARMYVDFDSTVYAELPTGSQHLEIRHCIDTSEAEIFEQRRDVRRDPYARAYQTHRPEWAVRPFMAKERGVKTLLVPVVALGRILGYWILSFPRAAEVSGAAIERIEALAQQLAVALDYQRSRRDRLGGGAIVAAHATRRASGRLLGLIQTARRSAASFVQEEHRRGDILARLPVGVLISTLWGEVEFVNARMEQTLGDLGVDKPGQLGLPALIASLSGTSETEVGAQLRRAIDDRKMIELPVGADDAGAPAHGGLQLHCVSAGRAIGPRGHAPTHFVLTTADYSGADVLGGDVWSQLGSRVIATGQR